MKIVLLHGADAAEPPEDPVLGQIEEALRTLDHEVARVSVGPDVEAVIAALRSADPAIVFNLAESFDGKSALESNVAALLNLLGLRYTGSSPAGLLMAGDKSLTKQVLGFQSVPTPQFATVFRGALDHVGDLKFPLIVKPPQEDASLGITSKSVVRDIKELFGTMDSLQREFQSPVMVEEFIEGREYYVGVLGNVSPQALPVIELDFSAFPADRPRVASYEAKWGEGGTGGTGETGAEFAGTKSIFPTDLSPELVKRMQDVAVEAFGALRLRDYGRVDLRVTPEGEVYVIEVNPNCYLEKSGEFARAAAEAGIPHEALVGRILELAQARYSR
ncbi:MAG: ATP-grasp domain-containing protein [Gemmatimonadaceae bacterium]|nr:ATP-grasp domain-containing protein [Gemmatimonadaceae bacterium]NUO94608.1 ATP-grasp domain-containing protein [Gemmatimonadaceae bacterium]NUP57668.1 ATP-grasp domain-containing protein [Gemmatimonadaceae bacterium]NUP70894.1 ATP-grasp domain-containing protein [Gemmatimonadaceae bacterium]NUR35036.1 ATP-grasp domain-containing protein [Gemmatimonadaceae bacterium]